MSDTSPTPPKLRSLRRRPWLIAGGVSLFLLGALVYFFLRDDAPPEDADFKPQWTEGGGPRNPLVMFIEDASLLDKAKTYERTAPDADETRRLESLVETNAKVLSAFEKLMTTDSSLWRWPDDRGTDPLRNHSNICQDVVQTTLESKATLLMLRGERQEAARLVVAMHQFGHRLLNAEGGFMYFSQAKDIQERAREKLVHILEGETSPDFLKQVQEEISSHEPQTSDLIQLIKSDYLYFKTSIYAIAHVHEAFDDFCPKTPRHLKLWLRPNRTIRLDLNFRRNLIAALENDWGKAQAYADTAFDELIQRQRKLLHPRMNSNGFGQYLWSQWMPEELVRRTATSVNEHRMLVTSIAIRRYELSRNSLPNTLQELVPEQLPAVPVDSLNHLPIEWDPPKRKLLARGLRRPGFEPRKIVMGRSYDGDVTFPLWWKAP